MLHRISGALLGFALLVAVAHGFAAEPVPPRLPETREQLLKERDRLQVESDRHEQREDFAAAKRTCAQALALCVQAWGNDHWQTVDARLHLARLNRVERLGEADRKRLREAAALLERGQALGRAEDFVAALRTTRQALEIRQELLGDDPLTCLALEQLADLAGEKGDDDRAAEHVRRLLAVRRKMHGESHPDYAGALAMLAKILVLLGDNASAQPLYSRIQEIRVQTGTLFPDAEAQPRMISDRELPADVSGQLVRLARGFADRGDFARAEPLLREAIAIRKQANGPATPRYADALNELAVLYLRMADYSRAEPILLEVASIRKEALGENHLAHASALHNLGVLRERQGDFAGAERLLKRDAEIVRKQAGESHEDYAHSLSSMAFLYARMGKLDEAEPLYRRAVAILQSHGEDDLRLVTAISNLGYLLCLQGDFSGAEPLLQKALAARKRVQGPEHPDYADCLADLGELYLVQGDTAQAEVLLRESLAMTRRHLNRAAVAQSERQQLAMAQSLRRRLDLYVSLAVETGRATEDVYAEVLTWKGSVLARRNQLASVRTDAQLSALLRESQQTRQRLAALVQTLPPTGPALVRWQQRVNEDSTLTEELEARIARRVAELVGTGSPQEMDPDKVAAALPGSCVLIDFLEYRHTPVSPANQPRAASEARLVAFVIRPGHSPSLTSLGAVQPIATAVEAWRSGVHRGANPAGAALRQLVWLPLEKGWQDAQTVLLSPDGALARIPFAALPGAAPGSYLVEEHAIAVVPVVRLLSPKADASLGEESPALLLIGNVDYGAYPASGTTSSQERPSGLRAAQWTAPRENAESVRAFQHLPATRSEVLAIRDIFERAFPEGRSRIARADTATEAAVRRLGPSQRYLHFATHGFFAPPQLRSALATVRAGDTTVDPRPDVAGHHPGLLSGLALAGANRKPDPQFDDGILTALEVIDLDLAHVDMVLLSACETGLGEIAGGEGVLGLQRAFQAAGAKTTVTSLWQVPDEPTEVLMERFYSNLWEKKLPKLTALREAQLWLLKDGKAHPGLKRGIQREGAPPLDDGRLPPYYWAAFVLSGDWR